MHKLQVAILGVVMFLGSTAIHFALDAAFKNPQVLYVAAQYKMLVGETDAAIRLLRRAAEARVSSQHAPVPARAPSTAYCVR